MGHRVALDAVDPGGGDVEEDVDEVVGEEVDLVDVEHALVGRGQEPGLEPHLAAGECRGEVERADDALLGGAERQVDEGGAVAQRGQAAGEGRLGRALVAAQQHAADGRVDRREQQRELGLVAADDRAEREGKARHVRRSSIPSAARRPSRSAARASSVASHSSRSSASRSRSHTLRSAHGFDRSKKSRMTGSLT